MIDFKGSHLDKEAFCGEYADTWRIPFPTDSLRRGWVGSDRTLEEADQSYRG